jgi:hypothetical protein
MTNRRKNKGAAIVAALFAFIAICCLVARGESSGASLREQREKEIAAKSEAERARLQRNFKAFRDLPAAEQEKLRQFDKLLKDDARNGGTLRTVMNDYCDWLASLTPGQAQDLREIDDPNRREKRVRELLKEQQEQIDSADPAKGAKSPPKLSTKDLTAVLEVVERALRERQMLSQDEIRQLDARKDLAHLVYVIELAFRRQSVGPGGQLAWMSKDVMEAVLAGISNARLAGQIQASQFPMERWQRLFRAVFAGIRAEYEKIKPPQPELELFFVQLRPAEQDEIMRLPFDQQQAKLLHMFLVKKSAEDPNAYPRPPQMPFWLRRPLAGARHPGRDAGAMRQPGANKKNAQKDRPKTNPKNESE